MKPFWKRKALADMTRAEFESLCDGCARCCLVKLEDDDTGRIHYTDVACKLLDAGTCRCSDYRNRMRRVKDCLKITPKTAQSYTWLPPSCGYRLVAEGRDLYWWHPLVSGDQETVHAAGMSVRGRMAGDERSFSVAALGRRIVRWPRMMPKRARARRARAKRAPG